MEFDGLETEYGRQRKRSDYRMKEQQQTRRDREKTPEGYEPSEQEQKENREPVQQIVFRGSDRRVSAGHNREQRLTMVFSKDSHDGTQKDEEIFRKEGSVPARAVPRYLRTDSRRREKGAQVLEDRDRKRKSYLLDQMKKAAEKQPDSLLRSTFPFLSTKEEKEEIHNLEDMARAAGQDPESVRLARERIGVLRQDLNHKEREKQELMKRLTSAVTPETAQKNRKGDMPRADLVCRAEASQEEEENRGGEDENGKNEDEEQRGSGTEKSSGEARKKVSGRGNTKETGES